MYIVGLNHRWMSNFKNDNILIEVFLLPVGVIRLGVQFETLHPK